MKELRIKDICDKGSSNLKQKDVEGKNGLYPVYGASGIISHIDTYHQDSSYIAIVKDGSGIGRVTFMPAKSSVIGTMQYILPKEGFNINYIGYCLQSLDLSKYKQGAAIPHIYFRDYGERIVKVTEDIKEQQSIVDYLDSAFAKIDAMKANAEKALNEAKALFQASLKEMLEPKEGWEEKKLKEVGRTQTGTTPSKSVKSFYGGDIPFIRPAELDIDGRGSIEYNSELKLTTEGALKSRTIRANSTLMCCIGSVGKTGYATKDVTCNQQINTITPYEGYNDKFVYYALLAPSFQNEVIKIANSAKATLAIISKGKWEELSIHIPLLSEQHSIVVTLDSLNSKVARLQENYDKISQECDALKQAILRQVFE